MEKKELQEKSDELLDILESHLISHTKNVFKSSIGYEMTDREAETVLAKIGKRFLLKVLSR